ncbi:MAG TPA: hypothetical protein VG053_04070 [Solirubrobacteraceae bacterium]|jgi:hypothetical protein|nr:hypothetical protein [Solirubrobacteraceae bacterium]
MMMSSRLNVLALGGVLSMLCAGAVCSSASASTGFGVAQFTVQATHARETPEEERGEGGFRDVYEPYAFTQAGRLPDALTTTIEFNNEPSGLEGLIPDGGDPKDVVVDLPPGLLADPLAVPRCPLAIFARENGPCPGGTQVGIIEIGFASSILIEPIYDLVPEVGQSAEFGIPTGAAFNLVLTAHLVHTAGSQSAYGFTVTSNNILQRSYTRAKLTFWGVPADPSHDPQRGRRCETLEAKTVLPTCPDNGLDNPGGEKAGVVPVPFLVMPTDCTVGPESFSVSVDSWQEPGRFVEGPRAVFPPPPATGWTGCGALSFAPSLEVSPDSTQADAPVGLGVSLQVPQPREPGAPRTPDLRNAVVTLPAGLSISPGVVDGVQACDEFGPEGIDITGPESERLGPSREPQLAPGHCPDASIVGTAEAITPLLAEPVKGHLYLARPLCGGPGQEPCTEQDALDGRLYRLYLELGGKGALAGTGIDIKVAGVVSANLATGQLTSSFTDNPQAPFSELKLHLNGGPRASLANPQACGEARTTSDFTPWSAPGRTPAGVLVEGTPDADPFSFYGVTGCAGPPGLAPGFTAGTVTPEAGIFTPFTLSLTRHDGEQDLAGIQVHTPPGLLGMLSSVQLCGEPEAQSGHCPEASRIGSTTVASGAGSHPFEIGGTVYLTTGYKGAPFGLSIVTNAVAGPFNLGLVVVRARIDVDPETSALTVTSDPLPQIVFGVPLRLQRVTVNIDRPNFMFNPTNCGAPGQPGTQQVTASVSGSQNALANVSSQFAVGGCKGLAFKPQFTVATSGHTSKANGASLDAQVSFPASVPGSEANIAKVKVELPKQLPSRLTTLQKACTDAQFKANPAGCPPASVVGIARASTPLLPVGLEGPVYFVSHGGEAFPSLIIVLQGDGVRVDLTGSTFISKSGITSSTFKTVPDVPVSSFELYLPEGPYSALTANGNLCSLTSTVTTRRKVTKRVHGRTVRRTVTTRTLKPASLIMPSEFVAQNGAVLKQNTKIAVTGCALASKAKAPARHKAKQSRSHKGATGASRAAHPHTTTRRAGA